MILDKTLVTDCFQTICKFDFTPKLTKMYISKRMSKTLHVCIRPLCICITYLLHIHSIFICSVVYASSFSMSREHYIIQMNTDCHALADRHNQGDKLLATPQVKCHSGKMIFMNGRVLETKINNSISSLAFDANDGLLYFVTQERILYVLEEGKPKKLIRHKFILKIAANGNYLFKFSGTVFNI